MAAKRASYRFGVEWIALNDEGRERNVVTISELPSTLLLADLFGKEPLSVARAILRVRERLDRPSKVLP